MYKVKNEQNKLNIIYIFVAFFLLLAFIFTLIGLISGIYMYISLDINDINPLIANNLSEKELQINLLNIKESAYEDILRLIVPFGIILSAAIASISLLKSINNTNIIEIKKEIKENKETKTRLRVYLMHVSYIISQAEKAKKIGDYKLAVKLIEGSISSIDSDKSIINTFGESKDFNYILYKCKTTLVQINELYQQEDVKKLQTIFLELDDKIIKFIKEYCK